MLEFPLLVPELLLLVFLLAVDGEPFRFFLLSRLKFLSDLDMIQIAILDVYVGGFFFYALAILPLHLFSLPIVSGLTAICLLLSIAAHRRALTSLSSLMKIKISLRKNRRFSLEFVAVLAMFIFFLLFNLASASGYVFGSLHDESVHSLTVQAILENKQVPVTLQPYLNEGIIYPQASHVIFAYASYLLNMAAPDSVFYVTILFKALTVFGAYFLGRRLSPRRSYYLGLPFVFTFVSSWPLFITWGANPFVVGLPLFLICIGLLFPMVRDNHRSNIAEIAVVGLIMGYCGAIIISYLETLIAAGVLISLFWIITRHNYLRRHLSEFTSIFLVSLIPLSPFLFRFFDFYHYLGHNIGLPTDFVGYSPAQFYATQALQWIFANLTPYNLLSIFFLALMASFIVMVWKTRDYLDIRAQGGLILAILTASALLSIASFFLPADFNVISWGHQGIIMILALNVILLIFFVKIKDLCLAHKFKRLTGIFSKEAYSGILVAFLILLVMIVPFVYTRLTVDSQTLTGAYGQYAITSQSDYDLMVWMKANLSSNAIILVNPNDAGLFIPTVSHQKIVFPWTASSYALSYEKLINLTMDHALNATTYDLLNKYNITNIFAGSAATGSWIQDYRWDPNLFLGNPNFKLVAKFGGSYLFQFNNETNLENVAFLDNLQNGNWSEDGWSSNYIGNGLGNVTTTSNSELSITAQAVYSASEMQYAMCISREIYVQNNSEVDLSFYLNATEGFSGKDTFAAIISNVYGNQSYVITTPNGIYESYHNLKTLAGTEGEVSFQGDTSLSTLWRQAYGSPLPSSFNLEFVNWDFDGVQNTAYLGNVTVTSTPSAH